MQVVHLDQWLPPKEAADALGISLRALQYRCEKGEIDRRREGRRTFYRISADARTRATDARKDEATGATDAAIGAPTHATRAGDIARILEEQIAARVAAEKRAAVAEYRAEIAETDPEVVEALREELDQLREALADRDQTIEAERAAHVAATQRLGGRILDLDAAVGELRDNLVAVTQERDEARGHAQRLADAMVKRAGIIRRLADRVRLQKV